MVGLSGKFIGMIERGESHPSFPKLEAIANALGVKAPILLEDQYVNDSEKALLRQIYKKARFLSRNNKCNLLKITDILLTGQFR